MVSFQALENGGRDSDAHLGRGPLVGQGERAQKLKEECPEHVAVAAVPDLAVARQLTTA